MAITLFRSNPALFRAMGVSPDEAFAFTDPMNTMADGVVAPFMGQDEPDESGNDDLMSLRGVERRSNPPNSIEFGGLLRFARNDFAMRESPATKFLERLLDPLNEIARAAPASLIEELMREVPFVPVPFAAMPPTPAVMLAGVAVAAGTEYVGEGLRPLPRSREPAEGLPYKLTATHRPARGATSKSGSANVVRSALSLYLKAVAEAPVLTREQEAELAKRIEERWSEYAKRVYTLRPVVEWLQRIEKGIEDGEKKPGSFFSDTPEDGDIHAWFAEIYNGGDKIVSVLKNVPQLGQPGGIEERTLHILREYADKVKLREKWLKRLGERRADGNKTVNGLSAEIEGHGAILGLSPNEAMKRYSEIIWFKAEMEAAKKEFIAANLRDVLFIARKYMHKGLRFLDLVQEGNLGLMHAIDKSDYRRGYRFSTYAKWWIRAAIQQALSNNSRTIRVPDRMVKTIHRLWRTTEHLVQQLGREPTPEEVAEKMGWTVDQLKKVLRVTKEPIPLQTPIGDDGKAELGDFIEDRKVPSPEAAAEAASLRDGVKEALATLSPREEKVVRMRFGVDEIMDYSRKEIGWALDVTAEAARQIEAKGLGKLRNPDVFEKLAAFIEGGPLVDPTDLSWVPKTVSEERLKSDGLERPVENPKGTLEFVAMDGERYLGLSAIAEVLEKGGYAGRIDYQKVTNRFHYIDRSRKGVIASIIVNMKQHANPMRRFVRVGDVDKFISKYVAEKFKDLLAEYSLVPMPKERIISVEENVRSKFDPSYRLRHAQPLPAPVEEVLEDPGQDEMDAKALERTVENPKGALKFIVLNGERYFVIEDIERMLGEWGGEKGSHVHRGRKVSTAMAYFSSGQPGRLLREGDIDMMWPGILERYSFIPSAREVGFLSEERVTISEMQRLFMGSDARPVNVSHPRESGDPVSSGDSRLRGNDKAPRRHEGSPPDPLLAVPEPDGGGIFGGVRAYMAAAEGRWAADDRTFGINGARLRNF